MINYSVTMRANPVDLEAPKKAYAQAQSVQTLNINAFAKHIADHGCVYDRGDIANILTKAVDCMRENLLNGNRISLGELGTFGISLQSKGAETASDFTAANITAVNVSWLPGTEFSNLLKDAVFNPVPTRKATAKLLSAQKAGETIVDLTDGEASESEEEVTGE